MIWEWGFPPALYNDLTLWFRVKIFTKSLHGAHFVSPLHNHCSPLLSLWSPPPPLLKQVKSHLIRRASVVSSPHIDFSFPLFVSPLLEQHFAIILIYTTSDRKSWVKDDATMTTSGKKVEWKLSPVTWQDILVKLSGEEVQ